MHTHICKYLKEAFSTLTLPPGIQPGFSLFGEEFQKVFAESARENLLAKKLTPLELTHALVAGRKQWKRGTHAFVVDLGSKQLLMILGVGKGKRSLSFNIDETVLPGHHWGNKPPV